MKRTASQSMSALPDVVRKQEEEEEENCMVDVVSIATTAIHDNVGVVPTPAPPALKKAKIAAITCPGLDVKLVEGTTGATTRFCLEYPKPDVPLEQQTDIYSRLMIMVAVHLKRSLNGLKGIDQIDEAAMVLGYVDDEKDFVRLGSWPELVHMVQFMGANPINLVVYLNAKVSPRWRWLADMVPLGATNAMKYLETLNIKTRAVAKRGKQTTDKFDRPMVGFEALVADPVPVVLKNYVGMQAQESDSDSDMPGLEPAHGSDDDDEEEVSCRGRSTTPGGGGGGNDLDDMPEWAPLRLLPYSTTTTKQENPLTAAFAKGILWKHLTDIHIPEMKLEIMRLVRQKVPWKLGVAEDFQPKLPPRVPPKCVVGFYIPQKIHDSSPWPALLEPEDFLPPKKPSDGDEPMPMWKGLVTVKGVRKFYLTAMPDCMFPAPGNGWMVGASCLKSGTVGVHRVFSTVDRVMRCLREEVEKGTTELTVFRQCNSSSSRCPAMIFGWQVLPALDVCLQLRLNELDPKEWFWATTAEPGTMLQLLSDACLGIPPAAKKPEEEEGSCCQYTTPGYTFHHGNDLDGPEWAPLTQLSYLTTTKEEKLLTAAFATGVLWKWVDNTEKQDLKSLVEAHALMDVPWKTGKASCVFENSIGFYMPKIVKDSKRWRNKKEPEAFIPADIPYMTGPPEWRTPMPEWSTKSCSVGHSFVVSRQTPKMKCLGPSDGWLVISCRSKADRNSMQSRYVVHSQFHGLEGVMRRLRNQVKQGVSQLTVFRHRGSTCADKLFRWQFWPALNRGFQLRQNELYPKEWEWATTAEPGTMLQLLSDATLVPPLEASTKEPEEEAKEDDMFGTRPSYESSKNDGVALSIKKRCNASRHRYIGGGSCVPSPQYLWGLHEPELLHAHGGVGKSFVIKTFTFKGIANGTAKKSTSTAEWFSSSTPHVVCHDAGALDNTDLCCVIRVGLDEAVIETNRGTLLLKKNKVGVLSFSDTTTAKTSWWGTYSTPKAAANAVRRSRAKGRIFVFVHHAASGRLFVRHYPDGFKEPPDMGVDGWYFLRAVSIQDLATAWDDAEDKCGAGKVRLGFAGSNLIKALKTHTPVLDTKSFVVLYAKSEVVIAAAAAAAAAEDAIRTVLAHEETLLELYSQPALRCFLGDDKGKGKEKDGDTDMLDTDDDDTADASEEEEESSQEGCVHGLGYTKCSMDCGPLGCGKIWTASATRTKEDDLLVVLLDMDEIKHDDVCVTLTKALPYLVVPIDTCYDRATKNWKLCETESEVNTYVCGGSVTTLKYLVFYYCGPGLGLHDNFLVAGWGKEWRTLTNQPGVETTSYRRFGHNVTSYQPGKDLHKAIRGFLKNDNAFRLALCTNMGNKIGLMYNENRKSIKARIAREEAEEAAEEAEAKAVVAKAKALKEDTEARKYIIGTAWFDKVKVTKDAAKLEGSPFAFELWSDRIAVLYIDTATSKPYWRACYTMKKAQDFVESLRLNLSSPKRRSVVIIHRAEAGHGYLFDINLHGRVNNGEWEHHGRVELEGLVKAHAEAEATHGKGNVRLGFVLDCLNEYGWYNNSVNLYVRVVPGPAKKEAKAAEDKEEEQEAEAKKVLMANRLAPCQLLPYHATENPWGLRTLKKKMLDSCVADFCSNPSAGETEIIYTDTDSVMIQMKDATLDETLQLIDIMTAKEKEEEKEEEDEAKAKEFCPILCSHAGQCSMNCGELGYGKVWVACKPTKADPDQDKVRICLLKSRQDIVLFRKYPFLLVNLTAIHTPGTYWNRYADMEPIYEAIQKADPQDDLLLFFYCPKLEVHDRFIVTGFGSRWGDLTSRPGVFSETLHYSIHVGTPFWLDLAAEKVTHYVEAKVAFRMAPGHFMNGGIGLIHDAGKSH